MSVNKVILIGNLGKDPELKYTPSGKAVATFSVACTEKRKDSEHTEWMNIVVWDKLAEICGKYLHKGKHVYIEGRIQTRSYDDRDGNKKYITEIIAHQMQMLGSKGDGPAQNKQQSAQQSQQPQQQGGFDEPTYNDSEEIPF